MISYDNNCYNKSKRNDTYFNIFINDEYAFSLSGVDILFYNLKENVKLSEERYNLIYNESVFSKAKEKAFNYIGYSARTKKEVYDKLSPDFPEDAILKIITLLENYNYLNDEEYAEKFINDKIKFKHDGKRKILFELRRKGVSDEILLSVSEKTDFQEKKSINILLGKRLKQRKEITYKEKQKNFNYLANKGFDFENIKSILNEIPISPN